jgi:hypothetical protein
MDAPGARRVCAAAGLGYVLLAGVENMDVLGSPGYSSPLGEITELYAGERALLVVTAVSGAVSLLCYLAFVLSVWALPHAQDAVAGRWPAAGIAGGVGAFLLAATGQIAHLVLVARGPGGLADEDLTRALHQVDLGSRTLAGLPAFLFLVAVGVAGRRTGAIPLPLARAAIVLGIVTLAGAIAGLVAGDDARAGVVVAFGLAAAWILAVSVWLLLAGWAPARHDPPSMTLARVMCGAVGLAAGVSGLALLAVPAATGDYFAWGLAPAPLAALVGGFYLASAVVYGMGARADWTAARVLIVGILALSVPIFAATLVHLDVFDFGRLAAWAWVVLFGLFPIAAVAVLVGRRGAVAPGPADVGRVVRGGLAILAIVFAAAAVALWADPTGADAFLPFAPPPLSGRVLAGWALLLATIAGWSAWRGRAAEAPLARIALVAFPIGALAAAARSFDDLDPDRRPAWIVALLVWLVAGLAIARETRPRGAGPAA